MSDPLEVLTRLRKMQREQPTVPTKRKRQKLRIMDITEYPELFQPRHESLVERHVDELAKVIKQRGTLDPVLVLLLGKSEIVLVDGHHRLAAYRHAGITNMVPVEYFEGTVDDAVLAAGKANSKAKLAMNTKERMNYAWRLVLMDKASKRQIAEAASVSTAQVSNMRKAAVILGKDGVGECRYWWQARAEAFGNGVHGGFNSDEEREEWMEAQANIWADRMAKEFGSKLSNNPELAAKAMAIYFGRKTDDFVSELREHVSDPNLFREEDYEEDCGGDNDEEGDSEF